MNQKHTETAVVLTPEQRLEHAETYVKRALHWSLGASLIPMPGIDIAYVAGVQTTMVVYLSKLYNVKFTQNAARTAVVALLGSLVPHAFSAGCSRILIQMLPVVGKTLGVVSMSIFSAAATYAVGKLFILHFESGGNVFNFDAAKMKDYFLKLFEEGRAKAAAAR